MSIPHLLVIGGTGFIGHHLLRSAKRKGWRMTSVSLNPPSSECFVDSVRYLHLDLTNRCNVVKYLLEDFDYVVNLGGYIKHQLFSQGGRNSIDIHYTALQNLLEVLPRQKLKCFVQIGSSDEYGDAPAPQHEELRERPISTYSSAKVASTHLLQMLHRTENFPVVILRLFLTYGPGQNYERFLPQIIRGCLDDSAFPTSAGEQIRDFCYVEDTVRVILQALVTPKAKGEIFNVASGKPITIREIIEAVSKITHSGKPQYGRVPYRKDESMRLFADISKIKNTFQFEQQVGLIEGLKRTISWYDGIALK